MGMQAVRMFQYICDKCGALEYYLTFVDAEEDGWVDVDSDGNNELWCALCNMSD